MKSPAKTMFIALLAAHPKFIKKLSTKTDADGDAPDTEDAEDAEVDAGTKDKETKKDKKKEKK